LEPLSSDRRSLGVCVRQLVLRDDHLQVVISHSHPSLCEGFHDDEEGVRRWTTGMGRVPERFLRTFAGGVIIEVHCLPAMPRYPLYPQIVAIPEQVAGSTTSRRSPISAKTSGRVRHRRESSRRGDDGRGRVARTG
jgi:hypothetical protein